MSILALTSDTLVTSPSAGQIEYSSPIFAATPIGTQRGIVPAQQYYRLDSAYAGSNVNTAQSIFGVGVTLSSSTVYEFEAIFVLSKSAGTTSHTIGLGFGGTATANNIGYYAQLELVAGSIPTAGTSASAIPYMYSNTLSNNTLTPAYTTATFYGICLVKGTVSINAGGTFTPQYTLSAAPGGAYTTQAGSYIRIAPLSASGANTNVGTWA